MNERGQLTGQLFGAQTRIRQSYRRKPPWPLTPTDRDAGRNAGAIVMTSKVRQWFLLKSVGTIERMQEEAQRIRSWRLLQRAKSCGVGTTIWGESYISGIEHVELGSNVHIGRVLTFGPKAGWW